MIRFEHDHRTARAALTHLAEPADPLLGALQESAGPCETLAAIRSGTLPARRVLGLTSICFCRRQRDSPESSDPAGWDVSTFRLARLSRSCLPVTAIGGYSSDRP